MTETGSAVSGEILQSAEQLLAGRLKRIQDAVEMKQPDRIPVCLPYGYFMADILGCTHLEMYSAENMKAALEKACLLFQLDYYGATRGNPGHSRILGDQMTKWPGYGLPDTGSFQYDEREYMKAEEYDAFINDPADWAIRSYTPRLFSELKGLARFPHFGMLAAGYYGMLPLAGLMSDPEVVHAFRKLAECGEFHQRWLAGQRTIAAHLRALGFPSTPFVMGAQLAAPFDFMSDTLRGMHGVFMDMFRRSDKLLRAEDIACNFQV